MKTTVFLLFVFVVECATPSSEPPVAVPDAMSFLGDSLYSAEPSEALLARYKETKVAFEADSTNIENLAS